MASSDDTVVRRVKAPRTRWETNVRVLGVDDWAWRKRQSYGTMLMDLEQRQVIDLLPVRSAGSFANWLGKHPEVEVITRDRGCTLTVAGRVHLRPSRWMCCKQGYFGFRSLVYCPATPINSALGIKQRVLIL